MNAEEFSFFNLQLAGMLKSGLPLEESIRQLCVSMGKNPLREELRQLADDLSKGTPLKEALQLRKLPELYVQMFQIGVKSNDLPAMLTMLADYYRQTDAIRIKLKGLMVYPVIVLFFSFLLSTFFMLFFGRLWNQLVAGDLFAYDSPSEHLNRTVVTIYAHVWGPPVLVGLLLATVIAVLAVPRWRRYWLWRLPGFREARLSQIASAAALMLKSRCTLFDAIGMLADRESGTELSDELSRWRNRISAGAGKFPEIAEPSQAFPPAFLWFVRSGGERPAEGFQRAADFYLSRANQRVDMLLYAALPVSVIFLGVLIFDQAFAFVHVLVNIIRALCQPY